MIGCLGLAPQRRSLPTFAACTAARDLLRSPRRVLSTNERAALRACRPRTAPSREKGLIRASQSLIGSNLIRIRIVIESKRAFGTRVSGLPARHTSETDADLGG